MSRTEGTSPLKDDRKYTLAEWRTWPEGERWELIDGVAYGMSPSPRLRRQETTGELFVHLREFLEGKPCRVFIAPLDVFAEEGTEEAVAQPDVPVVCDHEKVRDDGIHGAPDFVAEVLSDGTAGKDLGTKKELYERWGVKEYRIIHPDTASVFQYVSEGPLFAPAKEWRRGESAESALFKGFAWKPVS